MKTGDVGNLGWFGGWLALCGALAQSCGGEAHRVGGDPEDGAGGNDAVKAGTSIGGSANLAQAYHWPPPPDVPPAAVDLLFVVDNSINMADKQALLREALPGLVGPLLGAVNDVHIGVISSSLGSHGGQVCRDRRGDEHAHLAGVVHPELPSWNGQGFLAWDPDGDKNSPPGVSGAEEFIKSVGDHILALGQIGCGYEAPLEAMYRFLIDPEPPESVVVVDESYTWKHGVDQALLAQREAFLRPHSLLGIVVLSDEDDCSIIDEGQGWLMGWRSQPYGQQFTMPRATSACATDPNSPCCRSCASSELEPPEGCQPVSDDPECSGDALLAVSEDNLNLRCFDQKRRFGVDMLQPIERYFRGLSALEVPDRQGNLVPNPLFAARGDHPGRHPSRVFLASAVGVPWPDVSDSSSWTGSGLRLLSGPELVGEGRWEVMLGEPRLGVPPSDPLMVASIEPRSGAHPLLGFPLGAADSEDPRENPFNGHEQVPLHNDDLQYACIFPLSEPRDCNLPENGEDCDCTPDYVGGNRPLCQPPEGGPAGTMQYFAKAYPGLRHLELVRALGERAFAGSVCPKVLTGDPRAPAYGYNPLARRILEHAMPILGAP